MKHTVKAGLAALAATTLPFASAAYADDKPAVTSTSASSISRDQELILLRQASDDSREHAKAGFNIGLVLHVGDDITTAQVPFVVEHYRKLYQTALDDAYPDQGGTVKVFPRPNLDARASLITAYVGDDIFEVNLEKYGLSSDDEPALMDLLTAKEALGDIIRVLPLAKVIQADNDAERQQTASLGSLTTIGLNR